MILCRGVLSLVMLGGLCACHGQMADASKTAQRPSFLSRTEQDCKEGDRQACRLLNALQPPAAAKPRPPQRQAEPMTQSQKDVLAILRGMERARADQ